MTWEKSCGAVVFTRENGQVKYLLVANLEGIYGFPKGHVEAGETETATALREVREETGLMVRLIDGFRTTDEHPIPQKVNTMKQVVYFLGEYAGQEVACQQEELSGAYLVSYEEAMGMFQFESSRRVLTEAHAFLMGNL